MPDNWYRSPLFTLFSMHRLSPTTNGHATAAAVRPSPTALILGSYAERISRLLARGQSNAKPAPGPQVAALRRLNPRDELTSRLQREDLGAPVHAIWGWVHNTGELVGATSLTQAGAMLRRFGLASH